MPKDSKNPTPIEVGVVQYRDFYCVIVNRSWAVPLESVRYSPATTGDEHEVGALNNRLVNLAHAVLANPTSTWYGWPYLVDVNATKTKKKTKKKEAKP